MHHAAATLAAALAFVSLLAAAGPAAVADAPERVAPDRAADVFSGEIDVLLAEIEVVVTDRQGVPVAGLERDDFVALQDGRPVALTHFRAARGGRGDLPDAPSADRSAAPDAARADAGDGGPAAPLHLVVYIDRSYLELGDLEDVREALKAFLRQALSPRDRVMLVSAATSLELAQGFTTVPELVISRLDGIRERPGGGRFAREFQSILSEIRRDKNQGTDPLGARDPRRLARGFLARIQAFSGEIRGELQRTAAHLAYLTRALAGLPGRRAVIYVGGRVPVIYGRNLFDAWEEAFGRNSNLQIPDQPGTLPGGAPAGEGDTQSAGDDPVFDALAGGAGSRLEIDASRLVDEVARTASVHGIVFHTLDASGLRRSSSLFSASGDATLTPRGSSSFLSPGLTPGSAADALSSLRGLALETGGLAFSGSRDFQSALARIDGHFKTYYSLGFEPLAPPRNGRSKIEVRLSEARRRGGERGAGRLQVRHRPLLVVKDRDTLAAERTVSALLLEEMDNPLAVEVSAGEPRAATKGTWEVPVSITVPLSRLALVADGRVHTGRLSIFATSGSFDRVGSVVKAVVPVRIANQDLLTSLGRRLAYQMELTLPSGPQRIAVTVRDDFRPRSSTTAAAFGTGGAAAPGAGSGSE